MSRNEVKFDNFFDVLKEVQTERIAAEIPIFKKAVRVYRPTKPKGLWMTPQKPRLPGYFMQKNTLSAKMSVKLSEKIKTSKRRMS